MDFLLSLSDKAREKLTATELKGKNKSVMYLDQYLNDEDVSFLPVLGFFVESGFGFIMFRLWHLPFGCSFAHKHTTQHRPSGQQI
jgi:hypothetical protein